MLGSALSIGRSGVLPFLESCWRKYGDTFQLRIGGQRWVALVHPDAVHHVLVRARKRFIKGAAYDPIRLLGGNGIIFKEGPEWLRDRRLMQPSFHQRSIAQLATRMVKDTGQAIERMRRLGDEPFDFHHEMVRLSMQIAGNTLFGIDLSKEAETTAPVMGRALALISERGNSAMALPMSIPTPQNLRLRRAIRHFDEFVYDIIARARSRTSGAPDGTLLSMLLETRDEVTGDGLSDLELRDQVINLVIAGHETTALMMTWTWVLLAQHHEIRERVMDEVDSVLGDRPPTFEDIPQLSFTKQVLQESMRLRPPLWAVARNCVADDEIGGHHIGAGTLAIMPAYLTHRHPAFWDQPDRFWPERFAKATSEGRHKCAYYPFSTGPRICLGDTFAMVEGQIILAMLLQQCRGRLVDREVMYDARISLRPKGPVMVRAQWRHTGDTSAGNRSAHPLVRPLRWINRVGVTFAARGVRFPSLDEVSLMSTARKQTGLSDFGDEAFRPRMRGFIRALDEEAQLTTVGRGIMRRQLLRFLVNRLRIEEDFKRHPEIEDEEIVAPVFIVGFPRTGTTLLHNLLAQDPENRVPLLWELMWPSPPPEPATRDSDPRIKLVHQRLRILDIIAPKLHAIHSLNPTGPEECYHLFQLSFANPLVDAEANIPSYMSMLKDIDWRGPYRYHKKVLKLLQWKIKGKRWVLKAPSHLHTLDALLAVYPDAQIIHTHRDPCEVAASFCSTYETTRSMYSDALNLEQLGREWVKRWGAAVDHALDVRARAPDVFVDVHYQRLVADPIATLRQIYQRLAFDFTPAVERAACSFMDQNPQGKHGSHHYSLKRYGLDRNEVEQRFRHYAESCLAEQAGDYKEQD